MSKPTHVYLDLFMLNDDLNPSSRPPALSFNENRNKSFLEGDASDYFFNNCSFQHTDSELSTRVHSFNSSRTTRHK